MNLVVKLFKIVFAVFVILIVGTIIVSFFLPNKIKVHKTMKINSSFSKVQNQVLDLKNWNNWSGLTLIDTNAKVIINQNEKGIGSYLEMRSPKNGNMMISFTSFDSLNGVKYDYYLGYKIDTTHSTISGYINKKHAFKSSGSISYKDLGNSIEVTKIYEMKLDWFPINKLFGFLFLDRQFNEQIDMELRTMKQYLESNQK